MSRRFSPLLSGPAAAFPGQHFAGALRPVAPVAGVITHGPRVAPEVALTFDADMTPGMEGELRSGKAASFDNVAVRRILDATHTPATFFFTGMWVQVYPLPAREIDLDPLFAVEDHSYDHPGFAQPCYGLASIPDADKAADIERSQRAILAATGKTPRYFRFPGGCARKRRAARQESGPDHRALGRDQRRRGAERPARRDPHRADAGARRQHRGDAQPRRQGSGHRAGAAGHHRRPEGQGYALVTVEHLLGH